MKHSYNQFWKSFFVFKLIFLSTITINVKGSEADSLKHVLKTAKHDTTRIETYYELGLFYRRSVPDTAKYFFEKARFLAEDLLSKDPPQAVKDKAMTELAAAFRGIGIMHYYDNDFTKTKHCYDKSLEVYEKTDDIAGLALLMNNYGVLYRQKGDTSKALDYYKRSAALYEKADDKEGLAVLLNNIGYFHYIQINYSDALDYYKKALAVSEEINYEWNIAVVLGNKGNLYRLQGNILKSLECYNRSTHIREKLNDKRGLSINYASIARIYRSQGEYQKTLEFHKKSLEIQKELNSIIGQALSYNNIGTVSYDLGDTTKALNYFKKSIELYKQKNYRWRIANVLQNIGSIHKDRNELQEALNYYEESMAIHKELHRKSDITTAAHGLGMIYLLLNNLTKANKYAVEAYELSHELGQPILIKITARLLKEINKEQGNYKKAYKYFEEEILMQDSIVNEETLRETMRQQARYEYQMKTIADSIKRVEEDKLTKLELLAKDEQLRRESLQRYALYLGIIALLVFGVIIYRNYKQKIYAYKLLSEQNKQINKKNLEITQQRDKITNQNKTIIDSIKYAKRIQYALLPDVSLIKSGENNTHSISDSFILFKPKDIVSGDFYWANRINDSLVVAVADCTGHGVPGAFMSMLGISFLNEIVNKQENLIASEILQQLKENVINTLSHQNNHNKNNKNNYFDIEEPMDGINIVIGVINLKTFDMQYSGSFNPFYLIRDNKINIYKTDKNTIGIFARKPKAFTNNTIRLQKDDIIYMFSDGFYDQFDNTGTKRYKSSNFRDLIHKVHKKPMSEQKAILESEFEKWKGVYEQIDDVTVLGMKV